ncbi:MAG: type I-C CRISPR-associated endonuclease Cas1 [Firmicutes bacterium]|nr:type I-C CRISPR-associated endonuclease Cas1 [Bacillota bacterium]
MRKLLNVLYVTSPDAYLSRDGENVVVRSGEEERFRVPIHILESIVCFNYVGASPALMGLCAEKGVALSFLTEYGEFLARVTGPVSGNVLLRRQQYRMADDPLMSARVARWFVTAKIANCRTVFQRAIRDHAEVVDRGSLTQAGDVLAACLVHLENCEDLEAIRGIEGEAARTYFSCFNHLILEQKESFAMNGRNRRPPMDNTNALLSFLYTLLLHDTQSALETVGLDPYVGFLHRDRPGRPSLALDLMEELRPYLADRLALSLINRKQLTERGFRKTEGGGVLMSDDTRKIVLAEWQKRKQEEITHPYLKEKIPIGLIPYVQSLLFARYLRGDIDGYPPFFWR